MTALAIILHAQRGARRVRLVAVTIVALAAITLVAGCTQMLSPALPSSQPAAASYVPIERINAVAREAGFPIFPPLLMVTGGALMLRQPVYVETRCLILAMDASVIPHELGNCSEFLAGGMANVRDPAKSPLTDAQMIDMYQRATGARVLRATDLREGPR